ncbi:MAG: DNA mismatch repair endonuclease MutH [Gammaproteobacteria bacterium]|nr:DNA mismatch repair endonuclease MutH [Gammaproteobacteria bacterium]
MSSRASPPRSEAELLQRAQALAGLTIGGLARDCALVVPTEPRRAKGFAGVLLEIALGADAGSRPAPDFTGLGVELKTIPVDPTGVPRESTYLCIAPLRNASGARWEDSLARRKLARVLWIPLESGVGVGPAQRRIGWPVLWSPSAADLAQLRADWEELMTLLATGQMSQLDARLGRFLQIRPKAAHARALAPSADERGAPSADLPRGFYLRARFTRAVLASGLTAAAAAGA